MNRFQYRLSVLQANDIKISNLLDIGAYRGDFTRMVRSLWPEVKVWQIEADERQLPFLQPDAMVALLSSKSNQEVDFFTLDNNSSITTGSSMFRELTNYYINPLVVKKRTTTLDDLMKRVNFRGNWKNAGMVKMDTQGAELEILRGSENFIKTFQPKYFVLETSVKQYNEGAPLVGDIIEHMRQNDYVIQDIMSYMYDNTESLLQMDILFAKK